MSPDGEQKGFRDYLTAASSFAAVSGDVDSNRASDACVCSPVDGCNSNIARVI